MTEPKRSEAALQRAAAPLLPLAVMLPMMLAACDATATATPTPQASASPTAQPTERPTPTDTAVPTAAPEPPLSLALPDQTDPRRVRVQVAPEVPLEGDGRIVITVANLATERIDELVLRWPTELAETLLLAPFEPSQQRIADGGPPLWQEWTKWVVGPGERGEPDGTTSLGWGPLDPGATLTIPIVITRSAPGEVAFDLQVLAGEAILALEDEAPAELRVQVP